MDVERSPAVAFAGCACGAGQTAVSEHQTPLAPRLSPAHPTWDYALVTHHNKPLRHQATQQSHIHISQPVFQCRRMGSAQIWQAFTGPLG